MHTRTKPTDEPTLGQKIKEARENLAYWRRQKCIALNPIQRAHAGGLASLWENQLKTLNSQSIPVQFQP